MPSELFIQQLKQYSDIEQIVSSYVPLKKKGRYLTGLCPFHSEKTPSFFVYPQTQSFYCFGCGAGGDVITFIRRIENLEYLEAVRLLADRCGLQVPDDAENDQRSHLKRRVLEINRETARFYFDALMSPQGKEAYNYLIRRGRDRKTIRHFGLGYSPKGWDELIRHLKSKGFSEEEMLEANVAMRGRRGKPFDRFRNRVMFPIIDLRGDVIGFGGRVLGDGTPKYLNSPDSPVFNKSRNLFALNLAKNTKQGHLILTEGYMDTISLHQAGFDCAVASLGTSLTGDHAKLLSRFAKEVILCYDGDTAGIRAADRAIPMLERTGLKVRVLRVTGAKDPDEYIKTYGREAFARLLDQSQNYVDYNLRQLQEQYNLEEPMQRTEFARAGAELLSQLDSPVEREVYAGQLAQTSGVGKQAILQEIKRCRGQRLWQAKRKQARRTLTPVNQVQPKNRQLRYENPRSARAEEGVLRLLMLDSSLEKGVAGLTPEQFSSPVLGKIYGALLAHLAQGRTLQLGALEGELEGAEIALLADLLGRPASLENGAAALADCRAVIEDEARKRDSDENDDAVLMAARDNYRKKKTI